MVSLSASTYSGTWHGVEEDGVLTMPSGEFFMSRERLARWPEQIEVVNSGCLADE